LKFPSPALRARATRSHGRQLPLAALDLEQQRSPGFERRAALGKKVMRVVHGLDTGQLVVEAALRDLAANASEDKCVRNNINAAGSWKSMEVAVINCLIYREMRSQA
jgi:hypothetical protein